MGFGLNLQRVKSSDETNEEMGKKMTVKVKIGAKTHDFVCFGGQTVAYLKTLVAKEAGVDYFHIKLLIKGKEMIDPFSLADIDRVDKEVIECQTTTTTK